MFQFLVVKFSIYLNRRVFVMRQNQVNNEDPDQKMQNMTSDHGLHMFFVIHPAILDTSTGSKMNLLELITKTRLFKYIKNFISKNRKFSNKKLIYFHISAQNIDCGYSLELPR